MKCRLLAFTLLFSMLTISARTFQHPGLLHSREAIERTRQWVVHQNPVAMGSYTKLLADSKASADYRMAGPFDIIARDGEHRRTKGPSENDFLAAYYNALRYVITGNEAHAATALAIIRAYADRLQAIDGHDAPLCAGLQGFILVNACELLRYCYPAWTKADTRATEAMLRRAFLPVLDEFDRRSPYANGNWGAAVNKMRLALAVYTDDAKQYDRAIAYYRHGQDNGSLPNYLAATGQCQESGRDQAHVMLGLGQLAETCEVAWSQGDDLYADLDNRLMAGYEYTSRANLGLPVPFTTWKDLTGKYSGWTVLAEGALGQWRAVFEIAYNHYVGRRHLEMPATSLALGHYVRPEGAGFTCDNPGFGSLLFYQGTDVDAFTAVPTPITYKMNKRRPYNAATEPVIRLEIEPDVNMNVSSMPQLSLVRTVDCWPEYWDLKPVRHEGNTYEYEPRGARSRNGYTFADGEAPTTFLVRQPAGLPAFVDGGASAPAPLPFSFSPLPVKDGPALSADYTVEVRRADDTDGSWTPIPVLACNVDTRRVQRAAFAEFDMAEPVVVRITNHRAEQAAAVDVRPHSRGLSTERVNDSTVILRLQRPEYLSVEFGGERLHNLHLLVNAPLTEHHTPAEPKAIDWVAPNSQDVFVEGARLIYFGPGIHKPKDLPSEEIKIPSNCTVYLAPGAIVKARLIVDRAENVRIIGRGILDHPLRGIEITYSKNVLVDGITVLNPAHYTVFGGQSENITLRNIKSFSARSWSDGFDLMCCRHVRVENCFLRTSDDCIALYNHRWWYWGGSEDFDISRCVFWPDVAHPVNIGTHGDDRAPQGEVLSGVRIHDCDILYGREQGLLAIQCGDQNIIRDVTFDSIRIEGIQRGRIFDLRVLFSEKYNHAPGGSIDDIHFRHITVDPDTPDAHLMPSRVDDWDKDHRVHHFSVDDVLIGTRPFDFERDIVRSQANK